MNITVICLDDHSVIGNVMKEDLHGEDFLEEIINMPTSCKRILAIPSIISSYIDYILENIEDNIKENPIIILKLKDNFLLKIGGFLADRFLDNVFGHKNVVGIIIDRNNLNKGSIIRTICINRHVYLLSYLLIISRLPGFMKNILKEPTRIMKFGLVGLSGLLVNILMVLVSTTTLKPIMGSSKFVYTIASIIGFEVSLTWNFILHELWTFKDLIKNKSIKGAILRWIKYHIASIGSLLTQTTSVTLLSGYFMVPVPISVTIGVFLGFIVNYVVGRFYAWKPD